MNREGGPGVLGRREAGILLHPTSLPGGTLQAAPAFLEFAARAGCRIWQMLPLGPTGPEGSPYSPVSVFAGNTGFLGPAAHARAGPAEVAAFTDRERHWLPDYALFVACKRRARGEPWWKWPPEIRDRNPRTLQRMGKRHSQELDAVCRGQLDFAAAWERLRTEAGERGIRLCGDLPMFPVGDSADVWSHRELFKLAPDGRPAFTVGVPPDAFAEDGQHWGNPAFDWQALRASDFRWWRERVRHELRRVDLLRWDHFRGLAATWEVPPGAATAREGAWREVPGRELLGMLVRDLGRLPIVAENLGTITPDVDELRRDFGLPGMHVLQFAFDGTPDNPHLPDRHEEQGVAYTGTHDNDTTLGWFAGLDAETQARVLDLTGGAAEEMPWPAIRTVLASRARLAVVPMQDFLSLDSRHRMNRPGVAEGNWRWRLEAGAADAALAARIADAVSASGRC